MKNSAINILQKISLIFICILTIVICSKVLSHEWGSQPPIPSSSSSPVFSSSQSSSEQYQEAVVDTIIDGDTITVNLDNKKQKVRFIGVDAPESVSPDSSLNCKEGELSSDYLKTLLKPGQKVWLEKDISDTDRYNRLLRYIWTVKPDNSIETNQIISNMLNAKLVKEGYAQAKEYPPDTKYSNLFKELGEKATNDEIGVTKKWNNK